jgi:biotin-dependent carboxylase-like uncharacterized protein
MSVLVIEPGLSTTVQDLGRPGYREFGVAPGGAFDRRSAGLANALVGNPATAAVLEMTLHGGAYEAETPVGLSLAGAPMRATKRRPDGAAQSLTIPLSFSMDVGDRLILGATDVGVRTYLGVVGGWRTPLVLGSRSDETRLKAGDVLPCLRSSIPVRRPRAPGLVYPDEILLRVVPGPDAADVPLDALTGDAGFVVSTECDRAGLRLKGPTREAKADPNRVSTPVSPGAVQWAGGLPLVLGAACGTMGGYPHVAHVISADLDKLAQARPGDRVRFTPVGFSLARELDRLETLERRRAETTIAAAALDRRVRLD